VHLAAEFILLIHQIFRNVSGYCKIENLKGIRPQNCAGLGAPLL
jgi:hypothetical protein